MPSSKYAVASLTTALLSMTFFSANAANMTISGTPPATATVGQQYDFKVSVANANRSQLEFSYVNLPAWLPAYRKCGCLTGVPSEPGVYANIQIQAWDGEHFAQTPPFTIAVHGTAAAAVTQPLKISGSPPPAAVVGEFYSFAPTVVAPSGSSVTFAIANKPNWTQFSTATGSLSGVPAASSVGTDAGITISVSDGAASATLPQFSIAVAAAAASSVAGSATLSWAKPTQNTDGSPLTNLAGYVVRYGTSTAALNSQISIGSPNATDVEISNLASGHWYFEVAAINTASVESQFSALASKSIP